MSFTHRARYAAVLLGVMVLFLLTPIHSSAYPSAVTKRGVAKYYSPGVMQRVMQVRARQGYRIRYDVAGWAATTNCSMIGRVVTASINGRRAERYQVVDCSHPRDRSRHVAQRLVIEVDYASAVRNGFHRNGRAPAVVYGYDY